MTSYLQWPEACVGWCSFAALPWLSASRREAASFARTSPFCGSATCRCIPHVFLLFLAWSRRRLNFSWSKTALFSASAWHHPFSSVWLALYFAILIALVCAIFPFFLRSERRYSLLLCGVIPPSWTFRQSSFVTWASQIEEVAPCCEAMSNPARSVRGRSWSARTLACPGSVWLCCSRGQTSGCLGCLRQDGCSNSLTFWNCGSDLQLQHTGDRLQAWSTGTGISWTWCWDCSACWSAARRWSVRSRWRSCGRWRAPLRLFLGGLLRVLSTGTSWAATAFWAKVTWAATPWEAIPSWATPPGFVATICRPGRACSLFCWRTTVSRICLACRSDPAAFR